MATEPNRPPEGQPFGTMMRELRIAAGLTQEDLAERTGLSVRGISDLERGARSHPRFETVRMLADALDLAPTKRADLIAAARATPGAIPKESAPSIAGVSSLPLPATRLIGREQDINNIVELLAYPEVRLLTLTGPGGVGKTQLALAVARQVRASFTDGAVFVPLAPLSEPGLVAPAIAEALEIHEAGPRPIVEGLRAAIGARKLLLLLDNFEHLTVAAPVVSDLLTACPNLQVLVTSRERLRLSGEQVFDVPPLELPEATPALPLEKLKSYAAVRLFVNRARETKPKFTLNEADAGVVADVCRSLDGLPLALELAAARVRVLAPSALLAQLSNRMLLLTGGYRDAPARLQTMRQAIAWSYDLLSLEEQRLFRHLSVFVGGFTLEAAQAVMGDRFVLDDLASHVDKSLVQQAEQPAGEKRFSILETIREFGLDQLAASGEMANLRAAHAAYYLAYAEQADQAPMTDEKRMWGARLEAELPNMRAALAWAEDQHDAELMLRLARALYWVWSSRGSMREADSWLKRTIEASADVPPKLHGRRALLLLDAVACATTQGDYDRAATLADDALALAHASGDAKAKARAALVRGNLALWQGDWDRANSYLLDALAQWRNLEPARGLAGTLENLGLLAALQGNHTEAESWYSELLTVAQAQRWPVQTAWALNGLGACAREQGDLPRAVSLFGEALTLVRDGSELATIANCFIDLGMVAAVTAKPEQGTRLFGAANAIRERKGWVDPAVELAQLEQAYAPARAQLSEEAFAAAWAAGREQPLDQAIAEALTVAHDVTAEQP
jgi:predicted ATPase/DNA-binding XRE family transcriptional regulator